VNAPVYDIDGFDNSAVVVREPHDRGRRVICYVTAADQLRYNRFIARLAHDRGMSVGLKNDLDQIPTLLADFDFAVNEECAQFHECHLLSPFIKAGKAVLHVEYKLPGERFCAQAKALGFSSMRKRLPLGPWRRPC
jgi:hypothetical protein